MQGEPGGHAETDAAGQMLPHGYRLDDYEIDKCIGSGGFGITYLGTDVHLDKKVAVKEYFPSHLAFRSPDSTVAPRTHAQSDLDEYAWGLERFVDEARTLAKFEHPNVIRVLRYIERNKTAYIVMDFAQGDPLNEILKSRGPLSGQETSRLILPLMDGLAAVHGKDMLHRDVKPQNIIIRSDGAPVLIDFGAARNAIGSRSKSLSAILTPHFAPIEQYSTHGHQGPWTDIYSLGAVAYQCLCGEKPPEATERVRKDPMVPITERANGRADANFLAAIDWALSPDEEDRPQSVGEWRARISAGASQDSRAPAAAFRDVDKTIIAQSMPAGAAPSSSADNTALADIAGESDAKSRQRPASLVIAAVGVASVAGLLFLAFGLGGESEEAENPSAVTATPQPIQPAAAIPDREPEAQTVDPREREAFDNAREINTAAAMEVYLKLYPDGPNAPAARERLSALRGE